MISKYDNIKVCGISACVPPTVFDNSITASVLGERRCKKQTKITGVCERHVSQRPQNAADLAYSACSIIMDKLNWQSNSIDVLLLLTQNPIFAIPSTAFFLQHKLGLKRECMVFDINLGCSAATHGAIVAASLLQQCPEGARAIVLVADPVYDDVMVQGMDADALAEQILFGSAGSAIALEKRAGSSPILFLEKADGSRYQAIIRRHNGEFNMDGSGIFEFGINDVTQEIINFRTENGLKEQDIDFYVFHQAQKLMLDTMSEICSIQPEKDLRSLQNYGNTNGSSVHVSICANTDLLKNGKNKLLTCGFGIGLSWCLGYFEVEKSAVFPIQETKLHLTE